MSTPASASAPAAPPLSAEDQLIVDTHRQYVRYTLNAAFQGIVLGLLLHEKRVSLLPKRDVVPIGKSSLEGGETRTCQNGKSSLEGGETRTCQNGKSSLEGGETRTYQNGKSSIHGRNQFTAGPGFLDWLKLISIPQRTAYRCLAVSKAVFKFVLKIDFDAGFDGVIRVDGKGVLLSQILVAPKESLTPKQLQIRKLVEAFVQNKTVAEVVSAAAQGETAPGSIGRVAGGVLSQGAGGGGNRKDFPMFIGVVFGKLATHFAHYPNFDPQQIEQTRLNLRDNMGKMPASALDLILSEAKRELSRR